MQTPPIEEEGRLLEVDRQPLEEDRQLLVEDRLLLEEDRQGLGRVEHIHLPQDKETYQNRVVVVEQDWQDSQLVGLGIQSSAG